MLSHKTRERETQRNSLKPFIVKDETISLALEKASQAPELTSTGRSPNKPQAKAIPQIQDPVTIYYFSWRLSTNITYITNTIQYTSHFLFVQLMETRRSEDPMDQQTPLASFEPNTDVYSLFSLSMDIIVN